MRKEELQELLGVKRAQLDNYRRAVGEGFDAGGGVGKPVFIFAPMWLAALCRYLIDQSMRRSAAVADVLSDDDDEGEEGGKSIDYWTREAVKEKALKGRDERLLREGQLAWVSDVTHAAVQVGAEIRQLGSLLCGDCTAFHGATVERIDAAFQGLTRDVDGNDSTTDAEAT